MENNTYNIMGLHKKFFIILIFLFIFAVSGLMTLSALDDGDDTYTPLMDRGDSSGPDKEHTVKSIALFQFGGISMAESAILNVQLFDSITAKKEYIPILMSSYPSAPDECPSLKEAGGIKYAITAYLYPDPESDEIHGQIWIWNTEEQKLIVTDEMVYTDIHNSAEILDSLVNYLFSKIESDKQKSAQWFVSVGYSPQFTVMGAEKEIYGDSFIPVGFSASAGFLPFELGKFGQLGFIVIGSWFYQNRSADYYSVSGHHIELSAGLLCASPFITPRCWFYAALGGGMSLTFEKVELYPKTGMPDRSNKGLDPLVFVSAGMELMPFTKGVWKHLFFKAGCEFVMRIHKTGYDRVTMSVEPFVGAGWKF